MNPKSDVTFRDQDNGALWLRGADGRYTCTLDLIVSEDDMCRITQSAGNWKTFWLEGVPAIFKAHPRFNNSLD